MHTNNGTQPTPTPWEIHNRPNGSLWITNNGRTVYDSEAPDVWPLSPANAAFIVRACNAHDELVAALEDAEFLMRQSGKIAGPMQGSFNRSAQDARAVLAKLST